MISYFFFYKPLFMAQLLIAEFLFTCRLPRRRAFWLRYSFMAAICLLVSAVILWQPSGAIGLSIMFMGLFALTLVLNILCFDVSVLSLLFCLIAAYVVQHFAYCLSNCMLLISGLNANVYGVYTEEVMVQRLPVNAVFGYIFSFAIYYFSYYFSFLLFGYKIKRNEEPHLKNRSLLFISVVSIVISIFVNAAVVYGTTNGQLIMVINIYNTVCCGFIMYVLFGMRNETKMEDELNAIYGILKKSQEQYETSKKTIELINIKCHDLKQQIRTIGQANLINETALSEMADVISIYDSEVKTGKAALDVILTEKSLYCYKNEIKLTCMADGTLLDFMNEAEIYSMFGNAIDNAIAAVLKLEDAEKRNIGLSVCRVKGFVTVNIHNYFDGALNYAQDGMPSTTKADKQNHGFGLKSIRYIVEKYGGRVSVKTDQDVFNLNILFPVRT